MSKLSYRIEERIKAHHIGGGLLIIIGALAVLLPYIFSRLIIYIVGFALIVSGLALGFLYFTNPERGKALMVKALVLLILGLLVTISPVLGLKILTAVLLLFFLFAGITSFMLARSIKSQKGATMAVFVGTLSLLLDVLLLLGWPESTQFFAGLFLGVILILDGFLFLLVGREEITSVLKSSPKS